MTFYDTVVSVIGVPDQSYKWLAYATACIILLLACWMFVKVSDFIFRWK